MAVPYTFANQSGNIQLSELDDNFANVKAASDTAGVVTTAAQPAITSVGALTTLSVTGNVNSSGYFIGNGSQLTGVPAGSIVNGVSSLAIPITNGNVVTTVGGYSIVIASLSGQTVSGYVTATGNVTGGSLLTSGTVSAVGTATLGNVITGGTVNTLTVTNPSDNSYIEFDGTDHIFLRTDNVFARVGESGVTPGEYGLYVTGYISAGTDLKASGNIDVTSNILISADSAIVSPNSSLTFDSDGQVVVNSGYVTSTGDLDFYTNSATEYSEIWLHDAGDIEIRTNGNIGPTWTFGKTGNLSAPGNISATGNITGAYILGDGSQLTNLPAAYGNANVAAYLPTYTGNIALGNITTGTQSWQFNADGSETFSSATAVSVAAGKMWYNNTTGTWNLGMGGGMITQQIGEELFRYGRASAAITDSPLQLIYKTGTVGASGVVTFAPAIAGITDYDQILGCATEDIALNGFGRVTTYGVVNSITTNGTAYGEVWADNDDIYYNPVTGGLTKVEPLAPNMKLFVGTVINAGNGASGSFVVKLGVGQHLNSLSDVQITSPTGGQVLTYNQTDGFWDSVSITNGGGISVTSGVGGSLALAVTAAQPTITSVGTLSSLSVTGNISATLQTKASNATGTPGQICWDADYVYVCTATDTWKRSALTGGY